MTYGAVVEVKENGKTMQYEVCNLATQAESEAWLTTEIKRQKAYLRRVTDHYLTKHHEDA